MTIQRRRTYQEFPAPWAYLERKTKEEAGARYPQTGEVTIGQYRVTFCEQGPFVEIWIAENAKRHGHWRLVVGKKRDEILREAVS